MEDASGNNNDVIIQNLADTLLNVGDSDIDFEENSGRTLLVMQNGGTNKAIYQVWTTSSSTTNVTAENYIGVSAGNYTNGQDIPRLYLKG